MVKDILKKHALKLHKALYGLKQDGRYWYKTVTDILLDKIKFTWSNYDQVVFYYKRNGKTIIILFIYVDNIIIAELDNKIIKGFKQSLTKYISFTDGEELYWLFRIEVKHDKLKKMIMPYQKMYIKNILNKFGL